MPYPCTAPHCAALGPSDSGGCGTVCSRPDWEDSSYHLQDQISAWGSTRLSGVNVTPIKC